ncbi:MAG: hypothetical protein MJZ22_02525 [Candidatus Saccharibacteria bacterium]|nr:hypothetical protein [Candidatus Saccharibacteria bacterium]
MMKREKQVAEATVKGYERVNDPAIFLERDKMLEKITAGNISFEEFDLDFVPVGLTKTEYKADYKEALEMFIANSVGTALRGETEFRFVDEDEHVIEASKLQPGKEYSVQVLCKEYGSKTFYNVGDSFKISEQEPEAEQKPEQKPEQKAAEQPDGQTPIYSVAANRILTDDEAADYAFLGKEVKKVAFVCNNKACSKERAASLMKIGGPNVISGFDVTNGVLFAPMITTEEVAKLLLPPKKTAAKKAPKNSSNEQTQIS